MAQVVPAAPPPSLHFRLGLSPGPATAVCGLLVCFSGNFLSLNPEGAVSAVNPLSDRSASVVETPKPQGGQVVLPDSPAGQSQLLLYLGSSISPPALPGP